MTDKPTPVHPWPASTRPTAAQVLEYLRDPVSDTQDDALTIIARLLSAADTADRCILLDHAGIARHAESLTHGLTHITTELTDARERAARYAHEANLLESRLEAITPNRLLAAMVAQGIDDDLDLDDARQIIDRLIP